MPGEAELREMICEVGRRMWAKNYVAATDGNMSARLCDGLFLCTPSGVSKGFMRPEDILIANGRGEKAAGDGKVTSEFFTHLAAYEERPDVGAVVHAHPPKATAATLAGVSLTAPVLSELLITIGGIPTLPYAAPATKEGGEAIRETIRECDALLIKRHGSITVGRDIFEAYYKLEKVEHAAETLLLAHAIGTPEPMTDEQIAVLAELQKAYAPGSKAYKGE